MPNSLFTRRAAAAVRLGLVGVGCTGAAAGAHYLYVTHIADPQPKNEGLVQLAALALSSTVVHKILSDRDVHSQLTSFGMKVLLHPTTVAELKRHFKHEFTADTETRANLKHFAVQEVIKDRWVKEELNDVVKAVVKELISDDEVYPTGFLRWLGAGAADGIKTDEFKEAAKRHLLDGAWVAMMGPPPPGTKFI